MRFSRASRTAVLVVSILIWTSCGDTFRPVAIPVSPVPPDPEARHAAFVISANGPNNSGSTTQIDVSGDSNLGVVQVGVGPSHVAVLPGGARVYVANAAENTVSTFTAANGAFPIGLPTTISLPAGSLPGFVHSTESAFVYVANSGNGTVSAISVNSGVVTNTISVGTNPVALAETPDAQKLYAVNQGSDSVTSISPVDKTVRATIPTDSSPVWVVTRSDSQRAYVLNQGGGTVTVIDTFTDNVLSNPAVGAGANFMAYDSHLNRLYLTNPGAGTLSILDAAADPPTLLKTIPMAAQPLTLAALPDGSRAYVGSLAMNGNTATLQVTVINTSDNSVRSVIPVAAVTVDTDNPTGCGTARFRISMAAAGSNSRVYVGSCDAGGAYVIRTSDDTVITDQNGIPLVITAPVSAFSPSTVQITAASQSGSNTTYSYTLTSGTPLRAGLIVVITGMGDAGNNGNFAITGVGAGTFTVVNTSGVTASGQNGGGVVQPPPQNPVFVLAGP
jgi:YVTN family beta-propeller protein